MSFEEPHVKPEGWVTELSQPPSTQAAWCTTARVLLGWDGRCDSNRADHRPLKRLPKFFKRSAKHRRKTCKDLQPWRIRLQLFKWPMA